MDQTSPRKSPASNTSVPSPLIVPKAFKYPEMYASPTDSIISPVSKDILARTKSKKSSISLRNSSSTVKEHHKGWENDSQLHYAISFEIVVSQSPTLRPYRIFQAELPRTLIDLDVRGGS
ncbi:hypothetical protein CTI12_AA494620 [Artemisia annua]|uniref:Uncharacterized protein n=1 Tax=Artemisia annua TaxID=35608 RepID=A0A2U1LG93_ARTAN|nr:hypothetical protein CTI12_AA494620 [Artemisia annua]